MIMARSAETIELSPAAKTQFAQLAQTVKSQLGVADSMLRTGAYAE